jgi:hypothetical protein
LCVYFVFLFFVLPRGHRIDPVILEYRERAYSGRERKLKVDLITVKYLEMWRGIPNIIKTPFVLAGCETEISMIPIERLRVFS